jgi:solute carrier family 38 (sodium-coupled neutral amino acid transporter), member 11
MANYLKRKNAQNDTLINVARFCFGLNMFTTLPLELFVCREVIEQYFFSHESFSQQRHVYFTTAILLASMLSEFYSSIFLFV